MQKTLTSLTEEINKLWQVHLRTKFPDSFHEKDSNEMDFVMLDADIAGCVLNFVDDGNLNLYQTAILGLCYQQVNFILPNLNKEEAKYFERLNELSELVLKAVAQKNYAEHMQN